MFSSIVYNTCCCLCLFAVTSLVCSILTLTLISCDRFFGIIFAMKAHLTERRARTFIFLVWISAIGISSPLLIYREECTRVWLNHTEKWCEGTWPLRVTVDPTTNMTVVSYPERRVYYTTTSAILFFFPIVIMSIAYLLIILKLWSKQPPGESIDSGKQLQNRRKRRVSTLILGQL